VQPVKLLPFIKPLTEPPPAAAATASAVCSLGVFPIPTNLQPCCRGPLSSFQDVEFTMEHDRLSEWITDVKKIFAQDLWEGGKKK
jgi:hypothetical protein